MKAVVYRGVGKVAVEDVPEPKIAQPTDAILKVTSAAICGSDLHMYEGRTALDEGKVLGHEIMGVIEEVGPGVTQLKPGDRVVLPFNIGCGDCFNCVRGLTNACLTVDPENIGAGYGYAGMGPFAGGQAQKVLVPFADFNALKLPGQPGDDYEGDFILLADIFPTAWHANVLANVQMGSSVAIYGCGPVGLLSILSARLIGASEIFAIDAVESRLKKAQELGAIPINFKEGKPSQQIIALRQKNDLLKQAERKGEEKLLGGVTNVIDAIGYQARKFNNYDEENITEVLDDAVDLLLPGGGLGVIGVYMSPDPGAPDEPKKQGIVPMRFGEYWNKGIQIGTGQCPVKKYDHWLRDLIIGGKAKPGTIITHNVKIDEAPKMYELFDERQPDYRKIILHPND